MSTRDMAEFYRRYPYPQVDQVEYDLNLHDHLRYLAHACYDNPAPRNAQTGGRMLIAGCGTREAVLWGASLPEFEVHAVDLSDASIEISKALAQQLGVSNVRFERANFEYGEGLSGPYDLISSFGVLHHLESPERGLAQLEKHLAPGGVMALMVYSDTNRIPLQRAQRAIELLARGTDGLTLEAHAVDLCTTGADRENRLRPVFAQALVDHRVNRAHFADTMLNPREVSYTVPGLVEFLGSAGMELVSPVQPAVWDLHELLSPERHAAFGALPMLERMEIADYLQAPLFWVAARRVADRGPERPCLADADLFWEIVPLPVDTGAWRVEELVVHPRAVELRPKVKAMSETHVAIWRVEAQPRIFHRIAWHMVQAVDGLRTMRQIAEYACVQEGTQFPLVADTLRRFLHTLIDELALGTPDVTRCGNCPLRK
jgi:SAM-dependent methyltransferase